MIDTLLVIGGGVGGTTAALAAAKAGAKVVLVEKRAILGGKLAPRLSGNDPDASHRNGAGPPSTREVVENENIEVLTLSEVTGLSGEPGDFTVRIREEARYVTDACTQCNKCRAVCPVVLPNEYEAGLSYRKAIFSPIKEGQPDAYVIDIGHCLNDPPNYLPCQRCVEICEDDCILFGMPSEHLHERNVGAVIMAVGFDVAAPGSLSRFGYGAHKDVLTSLELEYLLAPTGPTGGYVEKPSNEEYPESALMVVTDTTELSWSYTVSQIVRLVEQDIDDITIVYHGDSNGGAATDELRRQAAKAGAKLVEGDVKLIEADSDNVLHVQYTESPSGKKIFEDFGMAVLASAVAPPEGLAGLAETLSVNLDPSGFVHVDEGLVAEARPGVYVVGCASGPMNIFDTSLRGKAVAEQSIAQDRLRPAAAVVEEAAVAVAPEPADNGRGIVAEGDKRLTEEELQERLERFVWSLIKRA